MAEILLYGIIGETFDKLDARTVTEAVRGSTGPLSVRINSPGGYVMEGLAIIQALRDYPGKVTIYIDGLAASMASAIAMVGAEVIMAESALMMVHKPWDSSIGNADDMRRDAAKLDKIEAQLVAIYAKRTGLPDERLSTMLAEETWLTADEALELGFVTTVTTPLQIAAIAVSSAYGFRNTPAQIRENIMPTPSPTPSPSDPVAIERGRVTGIMALASKHGLPEAAVQDMIGRGVTLDAARAAALDFLAEQGDALNIGHSLRNHRTLDNPQTYGDAVRDALLAKISGKSAEGPAAEFQGMTVVDIARDFLARQGNRDVLRMSADRVVSAVMTPSGRARNWGMGGRADISSGMHTTSDFPDLVGSAAEKFLIDRYKVQQSQLKLLASTSSRSNFLTHYGVQLGGIGALDQVNEAGEFKNRSISSRKEGYKIDTFGNIFAVSRQMLVNDGLQALADILTIMAAGASELEASMLAALINANPPMADGTPWFDAAHANLAASGSAISIASLDEGRLAMRSQKEPGSGAVIDARPKYLLTGAAQETAAEVITGTLVNPTTAADVNPFAGKLTPIADPRIISAKAWWLFADPAFSPALQISYLDGQTTPFLDTQEGWRIDGTEYKVRHDFGAGILDHRLAWKNPGPA
ncbi:ClpP-like prohead protease/major capsid protein fusion protein [Sphingobium sp.]|uniref:ClpP-like prohead protease/major capsid protein fusion protein n=1 Tax=Sphingobium sp. TaxID=1912891 RepID=UPI002614BD10|nr:ClpP-like prohead protease/major capsid protein fusion protein [Sphingobium sp.]